MKVKTIRTRTNQITYNNKNNDRAQKKIIKTKKANKNNKTNQ